MESIDIKKYKDIMHIKGFSLDTLNVFLTGAFLGSNAFSLLNGSKSSIIAMSSISILSLVTLKNRWKQDYEYQDVLSLLRKTDTYNELVVNYNNYINELAQFIKSFGFSSVNETLLFMTELLNGGYLSVPLNFQYKKFTHEESDIPELMGAKVLSGYGVCRHISTLLYDVCKRLDLPVYYLKCNIPNDLRKSAFNTCNHAVLLIVDNNQKYIYCPTSDYFYSKVNQSNQIKEEKYRTRAFQRVLPDPRIVSYLTAYKITDSNNTDFKAIEDAIFKMPTKEIEYDEVADLKNKVSSLVSAEQEDILDFEEEHRNQIREIAKKQLILTPYSDQPIKKWTVN